MVINGNEERFDCIINNHYMGSWSMNKGVLNPDEALFCLCSILDNKTACRFLLSEYDHEYASTMALMAVLPYVAKWFNRDRKDLLEEWLINNANFNSI